MYNYRIIIEIILASPEGDAIFGLKEKNMQGKINGIILDGTAAEWREMLSSGLPVQLPVKKSKKLFPSKDGRSWIAIYRDAKKSQTPVRDLPKQPKHFSAHQWLAEYFPKVHAENCQHNDCSYKSQK